MATPKGDALGTGRIGSLLFRLAVPAITAQLVNVLYNMVDRMYIGRIPEVGATALTGVGVSLPLIMIISAFASLVGAGGAPLAAIEMGRKNPKKAEEILGNSLVLLTVLGAVLTGVLLVWGEQMLWWFGASADTIGYGTEYMRIYACGTLFVQISLGMNMFITTQGFATTSMLTVLIGAVLNIVLDPVFIFVLDMGVSGAALATILSQAVSAVWVLCFLFGKRTLLRLRGRYLRLRPSVLLPVMGLGVSPFIMQATESVIVICFNASLQRYGGDVAVGAMTILSSVMQFAMLPLQGLTQGAQPIVSYNYGARNGPRVKKAFSLLLIAALTYTFVLWGLVMLFPGLFSAIFTNDPALTACANWGLRIYMSAACIFGAQIACQQTFLALGNAKASLFLAILRKIVLLIPLIFILPQFFADRVMAVFLAEPVADTLAVTTTVSLFCWQFRHTLRELGEPETSPQKEETV